jgi:hypothetical protein
MIDTPAPPGRLRQDIDALVERLARIEAERVTMCAVADTLHGAATSPTLIASLETLERDLTLAARAASRLHERAAVEAPAPAG